MSTPNPHNQHVRLAPRSDYKLKSEAAKMMNQMWNFALYANW